MGVEARYIEGTSKDEVLLLGRGYIQGTSKVHQRIKFCCWDVGTSKVHRGTSKVHQRNNGYVMVHRLISVPSVFLQRTLGVASVYSVP